MNWSNQMQLFRVCFLMAVLCWPVFSVAQPQDSGARIAELEARIVELEAQLAKVRGPGLNPPGKPNDQGLIVIDSLSVELLKCSRQKHSPESAQCAFVVRNNGTAAQKVQVTAPEITNIHRIAQLAQVGNQTGVAVGVILQPKDEVQFFVLGSVGFVEQTVRSVKFKIGNGSATYSNLPIVGTWP
jgi:hypothetical protein